MTTTQPAQLLPQIKRVRERIRTIVHRVLTNPRYIGTNISNRRSFKLKHLVWVRRGSRSLFPELHGPRVNPFIRIEPEILAMRDAEQERR